MEEGGRGSGGGGQRFGGRGGFFDGFSHWKRALQRRYRLCESQGSVRWSLAIRRGLRQRSIVVAASQAGWRRIFLFYFFPVEKIKNQFNEGCEFWPGRSCAECIPCSHVPSAPVYPPVVSPILTSPSGKLSLRTLAKRDSLDVKLKATLEFTSDRISSWNSSTATSVAEGEQVAASPMATAAALTMADWEALMSACKAKLTAGRLQLRLTTLDDELLPLSSRPGQSHCASISISLEYTHDLRFPLDRAGADPSPGIGSPFAVNRLSILRRSFSPGGTQSSRRSLGQRGRQTISNEQRDRSRIDQMVGQRGRKERQGWDRSRRHQVCSAMLGARAV